jgi:cell division protein ZapD
MFDAVDLCSEKFSEPFKMEHSAMKKRTTYEHPLNERVRSWLRLEHLFCQLNYRIKSVSPWDSRAAVEGLLEILDFISRNDLKPELVKELERYTQEFQQLQQVTGVDQTRLAQLLERINEVLTVLMAQEGPFGRQLQEIPLLASVRQRSNIPGGTCHFDLPAYHYWLQRPPKHRQNDLHEWLSAFEPVRTAIELCLYLIRNNATASHEVAEEGFFQTRLDGQGIYQLVRVSLPVDSPYYPEISGGKQRFSIRFFEYNAHRRAEQTEKNISFELCCCMV